MNKLHGYLWLGTTACALLLVLVAGLPEKNNKSLIDAPGTPMVLGASTTLFRGSAQDSPPAVVPEVTKPIDAGGVSAKSFLVYDEPTGTLLGQKNQELELPIASLTKLMTGFVSYKSINLNDVVTIDPSDPEPTKPSLGLTGGEKVVASDLFNAMLVGSCNDAAKSLANYVASQTKQNFVDSMNEQAKNLAMNHSKFSNPIGFDSDNNYSTAEDLEKLVNAAEFYTAFSISGKLTSYDFTSLTGQNHHVLATNKLIKKDSEIYAVKTGFTDEALGAMITKVIHQGHSFIIIVLGSTDREADTLNLKQQILSNVTWPN